MSALTKTERNMKIQNLNVVAQNLRSAKQIISNVKKADEDIYYSIPETERNEKDYHNINELDAFEDYLNDMINDLTVMVNELIKEN